MSHRSHACHRLLIGALGGIAGTVAMTVAMRSLHRRLPAAQRYPLPPREIIESMGMSTQAHQRADETELQDVTLAAHFAYGAATGALYGLFRPSNGVAAGAGYGVLVWAASYLGWIPGLAVLKSATRHPAGRNKLMLAAHLVWGAATALTMRELERAEAEVFSERAAPDATDATGPSRSLRP
jgi:uncharacterized membrane protein YagU involved in acid resistance